MAADKSLKDLSGAVYKIAENSPKIQKDVKDIRDAICGTEGILESLYSINENISGLQKTSFSNIVKKSNYKDDIKKREKIITQGTIGISTSLGQISSQIKKITLLLLLSQKKGLGAMGIAGTTNIGAIRTLSKQGKPGKFDKLTQMIEIIGMLRGVRLKDFIVAPLKLKAVQKVMNFSKKLFGKFKKKEEVEAMMSFVHSSIDMMKKLKKIWLISKPAQLGAKALEKVLLGNSKGVKSGGILGILRKVDNNRLQIKRGKKTAKYILEATGTMVLTAIILSGLAVIGIPAMLGALVLKGIIWLMVGTYKLLGRSAKSVIKGSVVLLILTASIISFSLGLGAMALATKFLDWKGLGIMLASLVGTGLAVAGIGLLAAPILAGTGVLLLMGISLGLLGLALKAWQNFDTKAAMDNIRTAVGGLRDIFGLELGKGDENKSIGERLGGGIMDIAMSILNFGKTFFIMGSLLLAGVTLGFLYYSLKTWSNFDGKKASENIKTAVGALKEVFGLDDNKDKNLGNKLKSIGGGMLDIGIALLQGGKALAEMAVLAIATGLSNAILLELLGWSLYNPTKAIGNMSIAITGLKRLFGLDNKKAETPKDGLKALGGKLLDMGVTILNAGKTLVELGIITIATAMSDLIRVGLVPWNNYNAASAISNMSTAINGLKEIFGLNNTNPEDMSLGSLGGSLLSMGLTLLKGGSTLAQLGVITIATAMSDLIKENLKTWDNYDPSDAVGHIDIAVKSLTKTFGLTGTNTEVGGIASLGGSLLDLGVTLLQGGKALAQMGTIVIATGILEWIKKGLEPWTDFNPEKSIGAIRYVVDNLTDIFGLESLANKDENNTIWNSLANIGKNIVKGIGDLISAPFELASTLVKAGGTMAKLGNILNATGIFNLIQSYLKPWEDLNYSVAITNIDNTIKELTTMSSLKDKKGFKEIAKNVKVGLQDISDGLKAATGLNSAVKPIVDAVGGINSLDISKASILADIFKSFAKIDNKPIDRFTSAVSTFADSCEDLIEALKNFDGTINVTGVEEATGSKETTVTGGVNIGNAKDLAEAIAEAIKSLPINVETNLADVRLVVNNETGRRVILTLDN